MKTTLSSEAVEFLNSYDAGHLWDGCHASALESKEELYEYLRSNERYISSPDFKTMTDEQIHSLPKESLEVYFQREDKLKYFDELIELLEQDNTELLVIDSNYSEEDAKDLLQEAVEREEIIDPVIAEDVFIAVDHEHDKEGQKRQRDFWTEISKDRYEQVYFFYTGENIEAVVFIVRVKK